MTDIIAKLMVSQWTLSQRFGRYMNDILRTIKQQFTQVKLIHINALHPNTKFALEV